MLIKNTTTSGAPDFPDLGSSKDRASVRLGRPVVVARVAPDRFLLGGAA